MWTKNSRSIVCAWQLRGGVISVQVQTSPYGYLPEVTALRAQRTTHGLRPGPALALWCTRLSLSCLDAEGTRNPQAQKERNAKARIWSIWYIEVCADFFLCDTGEESTTYSVIVWITWFLALESPSSSGMVFARREWLLQRFARVL